MKHNIEVTLRVQEQANSALDAHRAGYDLLTTMLRQVPEGRHVDADIRIYPELESVPVPSEYTKSAPGSAPASDPASESDPAPESDPVPESAPAPESNPRRPKRRRRDKETSAAAVGPAELDVTCSEEADAQTDLPAPHPVTMEQVRDQFRDYVAANGVTAGVQLLSSIGARRLSEADPAAVAGALVAAREAGAK